MKDSRARSSEMEGICQSGELGACSGTGIGIDGGGGGRYPPPPPAIVPSYPGTVSNMFAGGAEGPWMIVAGAAAMAGAGNP